MLRRCCLSVVEGRRHILLSFQLLHEESPGEVQRGQMVMVMFPAVPGRLCQSPYTCLQEKQHHLPV